MNHRITYLTGDATAPQGDGPKIIAHCLSDCGAHGAGFAEAIGQRWPHVRGYHRVYFQDGLVEPGACLIYRAEPGITIAGLIGQHGLGPNSLRLPWLQNALELLAGASIEQNASVHLPRIGCGLAGGKWSEVEPLIIAAFNLPLATFVPVFVYDLPGSYLNSPKRAASPSAAC